MVRDSLNGASLQTSPLPQDTESPEQSQSSEKVQPESRESSERLDLLLKNLRCEEDPESRSLAVTEVDIESLPTHLHPFSSEAEYNLVKRTYQQLLHSGYYWGPMTMEEAHKILTHLPQGTFLIRDSGQPDVFFTLSYQSVDGPTSVRVQLNNLLFNLYGSHRTFASLFALLAYYTSSPCKLTEPYRKQRPERLKQMCRRAFIHTHGAESISTLPGLTTEVKTYVLAYPYCI
ncbi:suppressor of cytokine signaling 1-like [Melanotaenia boesemani]|uniref:suppressor of cytokine signaling 1-like n=1 Tax=Melanotaenia boesemani TaxID=1250792 RepID=UPI001C05791F|nr:suppressor of cytokine signaling 1-like [Melanotaenia boesemani]XP_041840195.1 suppressor of cytokine signaling 1-like [Melanotaenia boesemani]